jgi:hypothetical protein
MVMARNNGLNPHPNIVAELGPGDSLGCGLAALISGSEKYFALDVLEHASAERDLKVFDELVTLFRNKADIPGDDEFPELRPHLDAYMFPNDIFNDARMKAALKASRLETIRNSIVNGNGKDTLIVYRVPWSDANLIDKEIVDLFFSQAVLEHVDDLRKTYIAMHMWLKSTGYISHAIDFKCHGIADEWNGHWIYSDFTWKLIRGKRRYLLNRETHSTHVNMLREQGFRIVCDQAVMSASRLTRNDLAQKYASITDNDLVISDTFIQAVKHQQA